MIHSDTLRLDKWLWFARLAKSRSQAAHLCEARRLRVDGRVVEKPSATVRAGAVLSFAHGDGVRVVRVDALGDHRGPYPQARLLYTELALGGGGGAPAAGVLAAAAEATATVPQTTCSASSGSWSKGSSSRSVSRVG